ncbi:hypothetical protein ACFY2W_11435 [Streptomyces sp. NPDC001262]|uniref:hypothetical protein n=1 Tax=Streptomyces TaxID=1883 RepID=UPI0036C96B62
MRIRTFVATGAVLAAAATGALTQSAVAAPATTPWSASYGTAAVAGTKWVEHRDSGLTPLVWQGTLKNTGSGCYSVWTSVAHDMWGMGPEKQATQCGAGSVSFSQEDSSLTFTSVQVVVCRGDKDTTDCGSWVKII